MARRVTPAQLRAQARQAQQKQKRAIDNYNRALRDYNRKVKKAVDDYNRDARAHNTRVRTNRTRLQREIRRLQNAPSGQRRVFLTYETSVRTLTSSFERVDHAAESRVMSPASIEIAETSEAEAANSVGVLNALLDDSAGSEAEADLQDMSLEDELGQFSDDLVLRWRGALYSLNPANPDAARHFCTSAREILTMMIQTAAPDAEVLTADPQCPMTPHGTPTRRAKVRYLLARKSVPEPEIEDFVEADLDNVIELFRTFNDGTHGAAGRFTVGQLAAIRNRVESAILFLHGITV